MGWPAESMLYRRLSGDTTITIDELEGFAKFLGVEPGVFFLTTDELVRNRCSIPTLVPSPEGQMELPLGDRADLAAVS